MAAMIAPTPPSLAIIRDISSFAASVSSAQQAWRCSLESPGNAWCVFAMEGEVSDDSAEHGNVPLLHTEKLDVLQPSQPLHSGKDKGRPL